MKSPKYSSFGIENDGDKTFRTGTISNADSAYRLCAKKNGPKSRKCFPVAEIYQSHRKSGSLNPTALSELQLEARNFTLLRMRCKNLAKINKSVAKPPTFRNFYRKSMSLRTTVTTEFGPKVPVTVFTRMRKKKWWKTILNAVRSSKFSTLSRSCWIKWRCQKCSQIFGHCIFCAFALNMAKKQRNFVKSPKFRYYRKSMSLKTTVTSDFSWEVEIMAFLHMCKENEPTLL